MATLRLANTTIEACCTPQRNGTPYWYRMYGLIVRSDFVLPLAERPDLVHLSPDVIIARGELGQAAPEPDGPMIAARRCPEHGFDTTVHRSARGTWIWNFDSGTYRIQANRGLIDVYPDPTASEQSIQIAL